MELRYNYSDFMSLYNNKGLKNLQYYESNGVYDLFFEEGMVLYTCRITEQNDITDFENNYKANANKPLIIKAEDSTPYVRVTEKTVGKFLQLHGFEMICPANETTNYDVKWTVDIEFVGARAKDENNIFGNYANMQLIDKDNILGYGAGFILHEFGKEVPSAIMVETCNVETTTAATINTGLYLRIQYVNNSETETKMSGALKYYV